MDINRTTIFVIRMLSDQAITMLKDMYPNFIEYIKVFENVRQKDLLEC